MIHYANFLGIIINYNYNRPCIILRYPFYIFINWSNKIAFKVLFHVSCMTNFTLDMRLWWYHQMFSLRLEMFEWFLVSSLFSVVSSTVSHTAPTPSHKSTRETEKSFSSLISQYFMEHLENLRIHSYHACCIYYCKEKWFDAFACKICFICSMKMPQNKCLTIESFAM